MKEFLKGICFGDVCDSAEVVQKYQNDANCIVHDNEVAVSDWCILFVSSHGMYEIIPKRLLKPQSFGTTGKIG